MRHVKIRNLFQFQILTLIIITICVAIVVRLAGALRPKYSETEIVEKADGFIEEHFSQIDISEYSKNTVFDNEERLWSVYYDNTSNPSLGDHFGVNIDDETGEVVYILRGL